MYPKSKYLTFYTIVVLLNCLFFSSSIYAQSIKASKMEYTKYDEKNTEPTVTSARKVTLDIDVSETYIKINNPSIEQAISYPVKLVMSSQDSKYYECADYGVMLILDPSRLTIINNLHKTGRVYYFD